MKNKKLIIVGAGEFAEIAYEYFTYDSEYQVAAFAVEREYRGKDRLYDLPIVDFEDLPNHFDINEYEAFVAVTYVKLNRARTRLYRKCKEYGYRMASYVSSRAFVWHNVTMGENAFIFENTTLQHHASIGNNVILWSGSYIGHRTAIADNCWIAPQSAIAGFCSIGENCFIGTNATIGDNVTIAANTVFGAGGVTVNSLHQEGRVYVGNPVRMTEKTAYEQFGIEEE